MQNKTVVFLSRDEALEIHRALLERFGGPPGVRDPGLLESALFRPRTGYYADLAEMTAALFESLIMNPLSSTATNALHSLRPTSSCA